MPPGPGDQGAPDDPLGLWQEALFYTQQPQFFSTSFMPRSAVTHTSPQPSRYAGHNRAATLRVMSIED